MKYSFRKGFAHKVSADVAGQVCEALEKDGLLTPKNLVDVSRPVDAPLHNEFNWNDEAAAELWRQQQARTLINSLVVSKENVERPVRQFFCIRAEGTKYESLDVILKCVDKRESLLQTALRELESFKQKYSDLSELAKVFDAIDEIERNKSA